MPSQMVDCQRTGGAMNAGNLPHHTWLRYSREVMLLRNTFLVVIAVALLSLSGCIFKKRKPPVPAQTQPPPITAPEPATQESQSATTTLEAQPPPVEEPPTGKADAASAPKPKPKRRTTARKAPPKPPPSQPQQQASLSPKIVIQGGGSPSQGQLSPALSGGATKQTTQQLLDATEGNLKGIKRTLSKEEEAMVAQIKDYIEQSRKASAEADQVRAHNLALKAHLLSDELVKR